MSKFLKVLMFCGLVVTAEAKYEDLYKMENPVIEKSTGVTTAQYKDNMSNCLYVLESHTGDKVTQKSFQEAVGHYAQNGAKVISHDIIDGNEVITFKNGNHIIHVVKQHARLVQIVVDPKSKNYHNFRNYLRANDLIPFPLDIIVETHALNADMDALEGMFDEYF